MDYLFIILLGVFLVFYVYKCIGIVEEGRHKNVTTFGRFSFTISGANDRVYDPETKKLVDGENTKKFVWIWWLFQKIPPYLFDWKEPGKKSKGASGKEINETNHRSEVTNHHRNQSDYDFEPKEIETGEEKVGDNPQNIKINSTLRGTIIMESPFDAQFRNSGQWHASVEATISGLFGWVISKLVYAQLPSIRGEKLASYKVDNTEPDTPTKVKPGEERKENPELVFYFANEDGTREKKICFIDCINYEILDVKRLGVRLKNLTFLDYEATGESQKYLNSLQENAVSQVRLETSKNNATALNALLEVKKAKAVELINAAKAAKIEVMKTENVTEVKVAEQLTNVKVWSAKSSENNFDINTDDLIKTALNIDISKMLDIFEEKTGGN